MSMKKILTCLLCVIFILSLYIQPTYCFKHEQLTFVYNDNIFEYTLTPNIKKSTIFDIDFDIKKHNRFGNRTERKELLKKMLKARFEKKVAINYLFPNLDKLIDKIAKNIYIKPKDSYLSIKPNTEKVFFSTKEIVGIELDKNELYKQICDNYLQEKNLVFKLPIILTYPKICKLDFKNITNLMSDFSTNISTSSTDRKHNIKNALNSLNKIVIPPGEIFSFNKIVGRRTEENGYRQAKIIVNNEFVEGIGGGVCQVSSTLYNAALLAGLEIVEANKHSKQVSYVKYGFDAMVNFGSSDLKFKNNTNQKITIITNFSNNSIRIRLFGEKLKYQYKLSNEIFNIVEPIELSETDINNEYMDKIVYEDEYFYLKKPSTGMEIKSFREKYLNNELIEKETLRHDKYNVQNAVKVFGTKKRTENICAPLIPFDSLAT